MKLAWPLAQLRLPPTVQGILASRIDLQPGEHKQLLQTLAVLGQESPLRLIRQVVSMERMQLERMLADLRAAEFIYERPSTTGVEYTFKHGLTQEVAYNSLLIERRKQIHECAAQAIEELFAANLPEQYAELAHHYGRSGNGSKAVKYLRLAAEQAMSRSAYAEATDQLNSALALLQTQPNELERDRAEITVRFDLALCLKFSVNLLGTTEPINNLERARALCERVGDDISLFEVLGALWDQFGNANETEKVRAIGEEMLIIAARTHNSEMVGRARFFIAAASRLEGDFSTAATEFDQVRELPAGEYPIRDSLGFDWRIATRTFAALAWWVLGFPERAIARSAESFEVARQIAAPPAALMLNLLWSSGLKMCLKDWRTACSWLDEAIRLSRQHGFMLGLVFGGFGRGQCLVQMGQIDEGLAEMLRWKTALLQGSAMAKGMFFSGLAGVYLAGGRAREGLEAVDHALELMRAGGRRGDDAELRRLKGELLLISDNGGAAAEAEQCFRDAIDIARRHSAKSWQLRATMSLARLLARQDRPAEARTMLAEIYNWFTEGFDTADLKDAKELLHELGN